MRRGGAGRLTGLELQSQTVGEGVALRLLHLDQNILQGIGALRILHRGIHLAEDAQIVEPGLGVEQALLADGVSRVHLQFALHHVVARMLGSGNHDPVDREALAFLDVVSYVFAVRLASRGLGRDIEGGVGESMVEVIVEDPLPIARQILLGVGLAGLGH